MRRLLTVRCMMPVLGIAALLITVLEQQPAAAAPTQLEQERTVQNAPDVKAEKTDNGVAITIDGQPFTEYLVDCQGTPVCWPIIGPTGKRMTRNYPLADALDTEKSDHVHHRSLWFTHGDVNKRSFWHVHEKPDNIVHKKFSKIENLDGKAVIETENDWVAGDTGETLCTDVRTLTFGTLDDSRTIDFDITITAVADHVEFGDTKEGCMGIRVPGTMKVDSKLGGHLVNAEGDQDGGAWGKRSPWVDYYGPVEGEQLRFCPSCNSAAATCSCSDVVGIAIMNHPSSFRYPTWWHVRTYGLFAANPFGLSYFEGKEHDGAHQMEKGDSFTLRYRIVFHKGDVEDAQIKELFKDYSK